ncbi:MAG: hypothetical protein ACRELB_23285 [Polyangiaceae bacterium]
MNANPRLPGRAGEYVRLLFLTLVLGGIGLFLGASLGSSGSMPGLGDIGAAAGAFVGMIAGALTGWIGGGIYLYVRSRRLAKPR